MKEIWIQKNFDGEFLYHSALEGKGDLDLLWSVQRAGNYATVSLMHLEDGWVRELKVERQHE